MNQNTNDHQHQHLSLLHLPDLAVLSILSHLPYNDLIGSMLVVCSRVHRLTREHLATRHQLNLVLPDAGTDEAAMYHHMTENARHEDDLQGDRWRFHCPDLLRVAPVRMFAVTEAVRLASDLLPRVDTLRIWRQCQIEGGIRDVVAGDPFKTHYYRLSQLYAIESLVNHYARSLVTLHLTMRTKVINNNNHQQDGDGTPFEAVFVLNLLRVINHNGSTSNRMPALRHLRISMHNSLFRPIQLPILRQLTSLDFDTDDGAEQLVETLLTDGAQSTTIQAIYMGNWIDDEPTLVRLLLESDEADLIRPKLTYLGFLLDHFLPFESVERSLRGDDGAAPLASLATLNLHCSNAAPDGQPSLGRLSRALAHLPVLKTLFLNYQLDHYYHHTHQQQQQQQEEECVPLPTVSMFSLNLSVFEEQQHLGHHGQFVERQRTRSRMFACLCRPLRLIFPLPMLSWCHLNWRWQPNPANIRHPYLRMGPLTKDRVRAQFVDQHLRPSLPDGCEITWKREEIDAFGDDFEVEVEQEEEE